MVNLETKESISEQWFCETICSKIYEVSNSISNFITKEKGTSCKIKINHEAILDVAKESYLDYLFLCQRRGFKIISEAKIAGIVTFRVSKCMFLHTSQVALSSDPLFNKLHIQIALHIGLSYINTPWDKLDEDIRKEIYYTISKRHMNQETLGLVFYTILKSQSNKAL